MRKFIPTTYLYVVKSPKVSLIGLSALAAFRSLVV